MGITLFDKEFIELTEKMGVKDQQSKILLRDLVCTYSSVRELKDEGGIDDVVNTITTIIEAMIAFEPIIEILRKDNHGIDEKLIDPLHIPFGLKSLVHRLFVILNNTVSAMESSSHAQQTIWKMKLSIIDF